MHPYSTWQRAFYEEGAEFHSKTVASCIRLEIERCDSLQGFILVHSLGGAHVVVNTSESRSVRRWYWFWTWVSVLSTSVHGLPGTVPVLLHRAALR